jgi:hypothetical protein
MLSARTVIIFVVVIFVLSVVGVTVTMLRPPDRQGMGPDSYGTRAHGFRALYEILAALGATEKRGLSPPGDTLDRSATLVMWSPDDDLISDEPVYMQRVVSWVRDGGHLVVALDAKESAPHGHKAFQTRKRLDRRSVTEVLGLPGAHAQLVDLANPPKTKSKDEPPPAVEEVEEPEASATAEKDEDPPANDDGEQAPPEHPKRATGGRLVFRKRVTLNEGVREMLLPEFFPVHLADVRGEGDLSALGSQIAQLQVPRQLQTLEVGDSAPVGTASVVSGEESWVVAAQYKLGAGEVVLVSDPEIFDNRLIGQADNSVLAVRLIGAGQGPIVWDEFYHGLTIRGSILFLLTRGAYAIVAVMILLALAGWLWRQANFLGPPLAMQPVSRRSVREYVEAMGRFFKRGANSRRFMLDEVRRGVLWTLRHRFGIRRELGVRPAAGGAGQPSAGPVGKPSGTGQLPSGGVQRATTSDHESLDAIAQVLSRHDPAAGQRLREAVGRADLILLSRGKVSEREILQAVKGLADCL